MTTQQQGLLDALTAAGWELAKTDDLHEWWADEVWIMRSVWSPQGNCFYLTFLVDPQADQQRKRGESVWAVKASVRLPDRWLQSPGEFTFSLGHGWERRLSGFISDVSRFRTDRLATQWTDPNVKTVNTCDECNSLYFAVASDMDSLCPECAHLLYGYEPCAHTFEGGRCTKCHWDGSVSAFCQTLKDQPAK
jgi:hypothetical protein